MSMDDITMIRELYREYWRCMIEKDADGLRALMADDYVLDPGFYQRTARRHIQLCFRRA